MVDNEKADIFLYNLRHATVLETRQTTLSTEILAIAKDTGINTALFAKCFSDGSAEAAFLQDLRYTKSLGIYSLPSYLIQSADQSVLVTKLIDFDSFKDIIRRIRQF